MFGRKEREIRESGETEREKESTCGSAAKTEKSGDVAMETVWTWVTTFEGKKMLIREMKELTPYFGVYVTFPDKLDLPPEIWISDRLKGSAWSCVFDHELYHSADNSTNIFWREVKANWYGLRKHPIGFCRVLWMSLSVSRLKLYYRRIRGGF